MSQIFDALLRSEAERARADRPTPPEATELLRSVEHQVASRWASGSRFDLGDAAVDGKDGLSFSHETATSHSGISGANDLMPAEMSDKTQNVFAQFRPLTVSLSAESRFVCLTDKASPTAEAFRLLSVRLRNLRHARTLKKLLITSTVPQAMTRLRGEAGHAVSSQPRAPAGQGYRLRCRRHLEKALRLP